MSDRDQRSPVRAVVREELRTWVAVALIALAYYGVRQWL